MSKIITKNQLNLVIESTLKEADYMMENKDELKLTKEHMDELHKEGHCMCDGKCLVYTEDIKGDDKKMSELLQKLASEKMDCVVISKEQMDMLHKDGKCDCDDNVTLSYEDEMTEVMGVDSKGRELPEPEMSNYKKVSEEDDSHDDEMKAEGEMTEEMCNECGGTMVEGICEGGCGSMKEEDVDEGNEFTGALADAKEKGEDTFKVDGKTYRVEEVKEGEEKTSVEESVTKLTEALNKTTNKEIMKEEMDFFNKMINYRK